MSLRTFVCALVVVIVAALGIAACGDDDDNKSTTSAEPSASADKTAKPSKTSAASETPGTSKTARPTATGEEPSPTEDGGGSTSAACDLLTPSEIEDATGVAVGEGVGQDFEPFQTCSWTSESFGFISVSTFTADEDTLDAYFEVTSGEDVDGIGERAHWSSDIMVLEVQQGDKDIAVSVEVGDLDEAASKNAAKALAKIALGRLD